LSNTIAYNGKACTRKKIYDTGFKFCPKGSNYECEQTVARTVTKTKKTLDKFSHFSGEINTCHSSISCTHWQGTQNSTTD